MHRTSFVPLALAAFAATAGAQFPAWYPAHNQVAPTVTASVHLDPSGRFVYTYTVSNGTAATQRINFIHVDLPLGADSANAPAGWDGVLGSSSISWGAIGDVDPSWTSAYDGDIPSFLSEIAPGTSRTGFEVATTCAESSTPATYYVQGYNHVPRPPDDDSLGDTPDWRDDAVSGTTMAPGDCSAVADWGNRRPGVDGFLGIVNFADGASLPAGPVSVQLRLSRSGEQVNRATFKAELNRVDVTSSFVTNARGDLVAIFSQGASPLTSGKNVLLLSIDGVKPGSTQIATDSDRITFTVP